MSLRSSNRYYAMPSELDLTPFRCTATESLAYAALLRLGPSTGYAVAHATRVARANTYGALEGLVSRTAALRLPGRPARYRATDPAALIAQLAAEQGEALDRLSRSLRDADRAGPEIRTVTGERAAANLIMQVVARAGRRAEGVLSARSEEHTSELQSRLHLVCRLLLEKKKKKKYAMSNGTRRSTNHAMSP